MKIIDCIQGTPEWHAARLGRFTASNMDMIITPTGKHSAQAEKYVTQIIAEKITGQSAEKWKGNVHTERGKTLEEEAADYYAMVKGVDLQKIGFCTTDDGTMGCSPDRLVGDYGALEIKTCLSSIMIEYYEKPDPKAALEQEHRPQTQSGLYILERKWIDTILYCQNMRPIIVRSEPNTPYLMDMLRFTQQAHASMIRRLDALRQKGFFDPQKEVA